MKKVIKFFIWIVVAVVVLFGLFLVYITLTDYKPDKIIKLVENPNAETIKQDTFDLMTWNIGYAGLGAEMDFFYDGGKKVRPTEKLSQKYLNGIKSFVKSTDSVDFWLLQEVDVNSRRSYHHNEVQEIENENTAFTPVFAMNYDVQFVPVPIYEPMGSVEGGILMLSKPVPEEAARYAYPLIASWPNKLFLLDRCFILEKFPMTNGKELLVLNTHNSAYVYDSALRLKELKIIKQKMLEEYAKGNYVIAGGDWNANPPLFKPSADYDGHRFVASVVKMNPDLFPHGWQWTFDSTAPTNRQNYQAFVKGENGTTTIDYFIVSPNIKVIQTKTIDLDFKYSDHNPVFIKISLNLEEEK